MCKVIETNMCDNRDVIWNWKSIDEAIESGRFEWMYEDSDNKKQLKRARKKNTVEEFIEEIGYPFFISK